MSTPQRGQGKLVHILVHTTVMRAITEVQLRQGLHAQSQRLLGARFGDMQRQR